MILQIPLVWIALICLFIGCLLVIGLLTLLVVAFVLYKMWFGRTAQMVNKIPCQPRHPIWGHLSEDRFKLGNAGYEWFLTNTNMFHSVFAVWLGPWTPVITPCLPEEIEDILKGTEPKGYIYNFLKPWMGKGLLINEGPNWFKKRRMITPAFHFDILKTYVEIFSKNTLALADDWEKKNQIIDLQMDMTYLSLDNIGECAFGVYFNAIQNHDSPFVTATLDASDQVLKRWINPLYHFDFIFKLTPVGRQHAKTLEVLHNHSIEAIQNRRKVLAQKEAKVEEKTKYFIDILLTATDEEGVGLTDEEIKNEVDTFMFEGHDTTSSGLMWTFYAISQHPEIEEKIVEELNEVLGEKDHPDFQDLKKLNYLTLVVKESHRMFPPVPGITRTLTKDTKIGNYTIPAGSNAYIVPPAIHMNDMIWPEPTKFDPLRFTPENSKGRHAFAYVPFSAGPRNCIGQNFALAEEKTVLATLLKKFKFTYVGEKITPQPLLTLRNEGPLLFHLTPRNKLC